MYLLDTCVFSEFSRKEPDSRVVAWAKTIPEDEIFLSVLVLGELLRGVHKLGESFRKQELRHWVESLTVTHHRRLVSLDATVIRVWAEVTAKLEASGRTTPAIDSLIAASAAAHGLRLVTRNVEDFQGLSVELVNPWSLSPTS